MNPYMNSNLTVVSPFKLQHAVPFNPAIFRYIRISGAIERCTLLYMRISGGTISCLFLVQLTSTDHTKPIRCVNMHAGTDYVYSCGTATMLIGMGAVDTPDVLIVCDAEVDPVCILHMPYYVGYTSIKLGPGRIKAPAMLKLLVGGLLQTRYQDGVLEVSYGAQRPALLLCDSAKLASSYGVRSINGVSGKYLDIVGEAGAISITLVLRDTLQDSNTCMLLLDSRLPMFKCGGETV